MLQIKVSIRAKLARSQGETREKSRFLFLLFCWISLVYCYHFPMIRREDRSPSPIALTVLLLLVCYASTLGGMIRQWSTDEDMGHGFLVPVVIAWIAWRERGRWRELDIEPSLWGFALLAAGGGLHAAGAIGAGLFASSLGLLLSIAGVVLGFGGFPLLRIWIFPLLLTLFMLPKLAIVYNQATLPLQLLASRLAAAILTISGLGVIREGNILDVGGHRVAVAEACNGIRFLLPLGFLSVIFA